MNLIDESHHSEHRLEWWFIHGDYHKKDAESKYFMVSFFRHNTGVGGNPETEASTFLVSTLDPDIPRHLASAWIENNLLELHLSNREEFEALNFDSTVREVFLENVREKNIPPGIRTVPFPPDIHSNPLRIKWADFSLSQTDSGFRLSFVEPETLWKFDLSLQPLVPRVEITPSRNVGGLELGMMYSNYPRLKLRGTVNGSKIEGMAWMDHQWGNLGWLVHKTSSRRVLGWDWFGINLEDGSDWVIMRHRDAENSTTTARYAVRRDASGDLNVFEDVKFEALRFWRSETTSVSYPVEWRIDIGEGFACFTFSPLLDAQEIPLFGIMRSLWEGAGKVTGTVKEKTVCGHARGEFQGYGYIFDFRDVLRKMKARIDHHIGEFLPKIMDDSSIKEHIGRPKWKYESRAYTQMLSEPVWDLLSREGKSWRPLFALHLLHALGTNPGPYEALVGILSELSHTGALMIDDIEDDSSIRRGRECIHLRYGLDVTINAANTLYFLPTLLIFRHPLLTEEQKLEIQEIMMQQFVRAHYGQALDLYWSRNMSRPNLNCWLSDSPIPKILQMYQLKTAAPMEGLAEASTVIAGSGEAVRRVCIEFAGALGVAFQIVDDIHGFSTSGQWRKTAGEDLAEGKLTYVFVQALKSLKDKDRQRLIEIIGSKEMRRDTEMLEEAARLIKKSGSLDHSRLEAQTMVRKKWLKLREFVPYSEPMALIHMLYTYLLKLDFN